VKETEVVISMLTFLGLGRNVFERSQTGSNFGWRREKNLRQNIKSEFSLDLTLDVTKWWVVE